MFALSIRRVFQYRQRRDQTFYMYWVTLTVMLFYPCNQESSRAKQLSNLSGHTLPKFNSNTHSTGTSKCTWTGVVIHFMDHVSICISYYGVRLISLQFGVLSTCHWTRRKESQHFKRHWARHGRRSGGLRRRSSTSAEYYLSVQIISTAFSPLSVYEYLNRDLLWYMVGYRIRCWSWRLIKSIGFIFWNKTTKHNPSWIWSRI